MHNGFKGEGITGISSLRVHTKLKDTICRNHRAEFLSASDTREIDGFAVTIRPVGRSKACHSQTVVGPRVQTIHCYKEGSDSDLEWHYVLQRSQQAPQQQASGAPAGGQQQASADNASGQWKVSAPTVTLGGELPANQAIAMSIDLTNATGKTRWPDETGAIVIKAAGPFPTGTVATLSLPSLAQGNSTTVSFSVTPATPGVYAYFACLSGLKDAAGWPLPETCGPNTRVTVGPAAAPVFGVLPQLQVLPAPVGTAQPAPQPGGAPRPAGSPANQQGTDAPPKFGVLPQLQIPPPQGAAPAAAAPQAAAPAPQAAPPTGQLECRGGEVKGILCWCGIGRFPRPLGGNVYQCQ